MKKLKVLHLLQSSRFSGAENVVLQIIDMFKNDYIEMAYCSRDGQIRESIEERNVKFLPITQLSIKEVKRVLKEYEPDIIHAHDAYASVIASLVGKSRRIISHMHGNHEDLRKLTVKSLLYVICAQRFDYIFWVSNSAYNNFYFKKYTSPISEVLYNVIDKDEVVKKMNQDDNNYNYDIVYVGRLTYPKNPERLIRVLKAVIEMKPNIKVAIIGSGDLMEETRRLANELGIWNNLSFLGFKNNPYRILHDAKVMIMTSRFEGTPMCALEAMALGVPIVSTPTDGLIDVIDNGITGFLSSDNNELAQKLVSVITNDELRSKLSSSCTDKFLSMSDLNRYKDVLFKHYI